MALRRWRTAAGSGLVVEGIQTGDGRVIAEGAVTVAPLPLPFAFLVDGDQHINLTEVAPQVGIVETLTRSDSGAWEATGVLDDDNPAGAELIRRMDAGVASHGARQLVSIDPDDWQVEIVANWDQDDEDTGEVVVVASGTGRPPARPLATVGAGASDAIAAGTLSAAAGEPDPGNDRLLFEMASDEVLERYVRMRIRGVTACAVSAFAEAFVELEPEGATTDDDEPDDDEVEGDEVVAAATLRRIDLNTPPAAWFDLPEPDPGATGMVDLYGMPVQELVVEQPDGTLGVPLTITADRQVFGHLALWGACHVGYGDICVSPPMSAAAYAHFHHGAVLCDDGRTIATGSLTVGCDHAPDGMTAGPARDHYANSGLGWADVRAVNGNLGVWVAGALRPDVTDAQLRVLRALSLSGDWRRIDGTLELIGALAVNVPGFGIAREHLVASALALVAAGAPRTHVDVTGVQQSLVASGVVQRCSECARRATTDRERLLSVAEDGRLDEALAILRRLDTRTVHLRSAAHEHVRARLGR